MSHIILKIRSFLFRNPLPQYLWSLFLLPLFQTMLVAAPMHSLTYEDIISISKPQSLYFSQEGSKLAFVVRQGNLKENCNIDTLYQWISKENRQEKLLEAKEIRQVSWGATEEELYILLNDGEKDQIIRLTPKGTTLLVSSFEPISIFALSPDGSCLYHTLTKSSSEETVKKRIEEG